MKQQVGTENHGESTKQPRLHNNKPVHNKISVTKRSQLKNFFDTIEVHAIPMNPPPTAPIETRNLVDVLLSRMDTLEARVSHLEKDNSEKNKSEWERLVIY